MPTGAQAAVLSRPIFSTFYLLLNLLLLLLPFSTAQPQDEALTLVQFRSSLVDPESALSTWNPATSPCSGSRGNWVGVLCDNGYVSGLQLERMNLGGVINVDGLRPLLFLRAVSFMGNNFNGPMPDWKKISAIKTLYLSDNQFSGDIPADAFKGMYSLKKIHLANNKFTGPLPTSLESPKLTELKLENNQFTGAIPAISSENLKILDLSNNQLEGPIPSELSKMDPAAFAGNKALCGEPVGTPCASPPTAPAAGGAPKPSRKSTFGLCIACTLVVIFILTMICFLLGLCRRRGNQAPPVGKPTPMPATTDVEKNNVNHNLPAPVAAPRSHPAPAGEHSGGVAAPAKKSDQKLSFVEETRHKFDLQDLMRASAEVLGSGNFGASYKAVLVDGEALVVKRFKQMNGIAREDFHEHMRRLSRLKHPNLQPLVAYLFRKEEKLLVSDYVVNGSLATLLHGKHSAVLSWGNRLKIIKGVAKGLVYLHSEMPTVSVPHGHLKSSNVLLDKDYNPHLVDYALAPIVNAANIHQLLLAYKSPEYAQNAHVSKKTDVWCLGTLILETLTGRYLAHGAGADLAAWVNGIAAEDPWKALDKEMTSGAAAATSRGQMEKMLQVGISCCREDEEKRWDLEEAVRQIEAIHHDD